MHYSKSSNKEKFAMIGLKAIAEEFKVSIANAHATIKRMSTGKIPKRGVFANIVIQEVV